MARASDPPVAIMSRRVGIKALRRRAVPRMSPPRMTPGRETTARSGLVTPTSVSDLQKGWWVVGLLAAGVGALGFQAMPPSRRLAAIEGVNQRQDSVNGAQDAALEVHQRLERQALDSINRQLGQLLAGQCVKERDRMARLLYDCGRREP